MKRVIQRGKDGKEIEVKKWARSLLLVSAKKKCGKKITIAMAITAKNTPSFFFEAAPLPSAD
jgi:hypothetical protein